MAREAAGTSRWQDGNSGVPARRIGREGPQPRGQGKGDGNVAQQHKRWVEVTPSQFTHEAEGLNIVRDRLPDNAPFRAWSNLEFRDDHGKWHEVDLLVLGRRRLHLVELKYYSGTLRGDDLTWRRDGHRAEDSPLKLARRKAQRLASKLQDELIRWAQETGARIPDPRAVVPFVQEAVFLHHPGIRCLLPQTSRIDLFGLDGSEHETGLPGISERLLEPPTPQHSVGANRDEIIVSAHGADRIRPAPPARGGVLGNRRGRRWARVTAGRTGQRSTGWPPPSAAGSGSWSRRPVLRRPPGPRSAKSPSTSTGSCRGWPATACCARGTWWTVTWVSAWSTRSTTGSSGLTCGWPTTRAASRPRNNFGCCARSPRPWRTRTGTGWSTAV